MIGALSQELTTVALLTALILVFYIAYKILSMVTHTILIAVMSGIFYAVLTTFLDLALTIENILFFAVAGAALYVGYTILATTVSIAKHVITVPIKIIELIIYPFRKILGKVKKKHKEVERQKKRNKKEKTQEKEAKTSKNGERETGEKEDTKEVVIDKIAEEKEDKDE